MTRFNASAWLLLALAAAVELSGCDGESSTSDDGKGGSGASDGGTGAGKGGTTSGSSGAGGDLGGFPPTGGKGGAPSGGVAGDGTTAGQPGEGGAPGGAGGDTGEGGAGPDETTVIGRVVDFWMQPLVNVPVTIGTTTITTDHFGEFEIAGVAPEYDASLVVSWPGGQAGVYAWRFEGLTRRNPTLQVYKGRENRYADIVLDPQGETLDASRTLFVALGGPNGTDTFEDVGGSGVSTSTTWAGPETTQASLHALIWELDGNDLPVVYRSFDSVLATFDSSSTVDTTVTLSLADETIPSGTVSGSVTSSNSADRANYALVRFPDGSSVRVVADEPGPDAFTYVVPTLPTGSITVAASSGYSFRGAFAVAHRDGLAAGQSGVALTIPTPVTQIAPQTSTTNVGPTTQFSWSGAAGPYVFHAEDVYFYEGIYVVTTRRSITFPTFGDFTPRAEELYNWRVERHGSATSMDELAGPQGYLDAFSRTDEYAEGPRTGDGSYTISTGRVFTTAP